MKNTEFETKENTCYDGDINLAHAIVFMKTNVRTCLINFLYEIINDEWSFHYANNTCLSDDERIEFENWFITCG